VARPRWTAGFLEHDRDGVIRNAQSWKLHESLLRGERRSRCLRTLGQRTGLRAGVVADGGWGLVSYRAGRWVWEPYWGWTWVSSEPWAGRPITTAAGFSMENPGCGGGAG